MGQKLTPYAFLLLAGILYALGFPSFIADSLLITPIIGIAVLFHYILNTESLKKSITYVLVFNLAFNYMSFYWIASTLEEFGQLPFVIASMMAALFTLVVTPYLWVAIIVIWFIYRKGWLRPENILKSGFETHLLACILTLVEHYTPSQFPTNLGGPWVAIGEYLGFASVGGLPIYSYFSYLLVFEILAFIRHKKISNFNMASIFLFIIINPFLGHKHDTTKGSPLNIRVVQANISNFLKVDSEKGSYPSVQEVINRYRELSMAPYAGGTKPDLIIWPETAYPFSIATDKQDISRSLIPPVFHEVLDYWKTEMLVGGYDHLKNDPSGTYYQTEYNTAFLFGADKSIKDVYHKQILIPFGETLPLGPLNKYVAKYVENISFFSVGERFTLFELATKHRLIGAICYEVLKPDYIREYLNSLEKRPHAIVNLTNDSWYGDTAEPHQHLFLTKWRALENQLPIIRSTNTGITSVIYTDGSESARLPVGHTGNLDIPVNLVEQKPTVYQLYGFLALIPLWLLYFIFHQLLIRLNSDKNK
jgi:apolipoprotein N-acyltransferase